MDTYNACPAERQAINGEIRATRGLRRVGLEGQSSDEAEGS